MWAYRARMLRVARRYAASREDAEDAVGEAMLRAVQQPALDEIRLGGWLVTVTMRLCVDARRRRVREAGKWARVTGRAVVPQPEQRVEEETCERAEAARLASSISRLPARQAQVLLLVAAGYGVAQVADELAVSYRTAESLLARARRAVRTALSE